MAQKQMVCQLCEKSTNVKWKCINCDLILCDNCKTNIHSKIQTSEEHDIIDLKEFNTNSAVETIRSLGVKNIPCKNHASEKCIIYCCDCEILLCSSCLVESLGNHANHKISKIADVYQQKLQKLKDLEGKSYDNITFFSKTEEELDKALSKGQTQYNAIKQNILTREAEIKQAAMKKSENLVKELDKLWKPEEDQIVQKLREIREKKGDLTQQVSHIKDTLLSQKAMSIFTACETTADVPVLPTNIKSSVKQIILSKPRPVETIVNLGLLRTVPELKVKHSYRSKQSIYKIKTTDDGTNIFCSIASKIICKFELKDSKCMTTTLVENIDILDMTINKQGKLLFSISKNSEVKYLTKLSPDAKIETYTSIAPLYPWAIHSTDKNILIGYCEDGSLFPPTKESRRGIIVQDYNGSHIRTLECDTNNDRIFSLPHRITTNINGDICVVDRKMDNWEGRVVGLTELGSVKWAYEGHSGIKTKNKFVPCDLVTTDEGFILVADRDSNAVHVLSMDGHLLTRLTEIHGIERPLCLNIDKSGKLMIGCNRFRTMDNEAKLHVVEYIV